MGRRRREGFVYFISCLANGYIKIGFTERDVAARFAKHRVNSPVPLELLGVIPGGRPQEREIHVRFAALWSHGEWFRGEPSLLDWITENVPAWPGDDPPLARSLVSPRVPRVRPRPEPVEEWAARTSLTCRGETRTMKEWSEYSGINVKDLRQRHNLGVHPDNMLTHLVCRGRDVIFPDRPIECFRRGNGLRAQDPSRTRYGPLQEMLEELKDPTPRCPRETPAQ